VFYGFNPRMIPADVNPTCRMVQSLDEGDNINNSFDTASLQSEEDEETIHSKENTKGGSKLHEDGGEDILAEEAEEDDEEVENKRGHKKLSPRKESFIMEIENGEEVDMQLK